MTFSGSADMPFGRAWQHSQICASLKDVASDEKDGSHIPPQSLLQNIVRSADCANLVRSSHGKNDSIHNCDRRAQPGPCRYQIGYGIGGAQHGKKRETGKAGKDSTAVPSGKARSENFPCTAIRCPVTSIVAVFAE